MSPTAWAVDPSGAAETPLAKATPKGTTFTYTLSERARVVFTIERKLPGRRVAGKCVKPTAANQAKPKCSRYVRVGRFAQQAAKGKDSKRFSGRIGTHSLPAGSYRATLVARDVVGLRSLPKRVSFTVVH